MAYSVEKLGLTPAMEEPPTLLGLWIAGARSA